MRRDGEQGSAEPARRPGLIDRLVDRRPLDGEPTELPDREAIARMFLYLFGSGAVVALLTLLLPGAPDRDELGVVAVSAAALLTAAAFLYVFDRIPIVVLRLAPAFGTLLIGLLAYSGGTAAVPAYLFFLIWVSLAASYFFGLAEAIGHAALATVAVVVLLVVRDGVELPGLLVAMVAGTLLVNGVVMVSLRRQFDRLVLRLERAARTDVLTGLANRREFNERFADELSRCARSGSPFSVLVLDLDSFKLLNDRYGHDAGDDALRSFARILGEGSRRIDTTARVGGEEFAVIAAETAADDAVVLAERLRLATEREFADAFGLTVSCGIATFPDAGSEAEDLLRAADRALYAAKQEGRNRVVVHRPSAGGEGAADSGGETPRYRGPLAEPGAGTA